MTHVTCRLTTKNRDQLRNPTLGNRVWAVFLRRAATVVDGVDEAAQFELDSVADRQPMQLDKGRGRDVIVNAIDVKTFLRFFIFSRFYVFNVFLIFQTFFKKRWQSSEWQEDSRSTIKKQQRNSMIFLLHVE